MNARTRRERRGVLAGGNWLVDEVHVVDVYPEPEQLGTILSRFQGTGGAAYNVLIALARLKSPFPLYGAGLIGRDAFGRQILQDCRRRGIDTRHLRSSAAVPTSFTNVMTERDTGRRTFFHSRGANAFWRGNDLDFGRIPARIFHFGYLLLLDELDKPDAAFGTRAARLLAAAQRAGLKTSIDSASVASDQFLKVAAPALKRADYCILNEIEAGNITGIRTRNRGGILAPAGLRRAAAALMDLGVGELAVIHCPEGAQARTRSGRETWQSSLRIPAGYIQGTTGAGDAFCAGLLIGLHEGWELERSLRAGTCVAAASMSHPTATGGIHSLARSLALAKEYGYRRPPALRRG